MGEMQIGPSASRRKPSISWNLNDLAETPQGAPRGQKSNFLVAEAAQGPKMQFLIAETSQGPKKKLFLMAKAPPGPMCVWVFCESAPGVSKVTYFTMSGAPGERQKGKNIYCCGSPHPKKKAMFVPGMCVFSSMF